MKLIKKILLILASFWILLSSTMAIARIYFFITNDTTYEESEYHVRHNKYLQYDYYIDKIDSPFLNRFSPANYEIIDYLKINEKRCGINKSNIETYNPPPDIIYKFKELYGKWPKSLRDFSEANILHVYFIQNASFRGLIHPVYRYLDSSYSFILFIDEKNFTTKPNELESYKNSLITIDDSEKISFETIVEEPANNAIERSVEQIFLHEIGHGFGVTKGLTSNFIPVLGPVSNYSFYSVLNDIYYIEDIQWKLRSDKFKFFEDLHFYGFPKKKRLSKGQVENYLTSLKKSPFPTLYSTQNEYEFFSESFYSYVHCVIQKRPYKYVLKYPNGKKMEIENGFLDGRCEKTKLIFDSLILDINPSDFTNTMIAID